MLVIRFIQARLLTVVVAGSVFGLALDGGGYGVTSRNAVAVIIWWALALAVALSVLPLRRPPAGALVTGGLLTAFAIFTGLSAIWAESAERAFLELDRVLLYVGVFAVAVAVGDRRNARQWIDGMAIGIVAVGLLALASRLFGDLAGDQGFTRLLPGVSVRLSYPVDYWNGLAVLVALSFPLLLEAASRRHAPVLRAAALAPVPALVAVLYLTSSRGGAATAVIGTIVLLAFTARRLATLGAVFSGAAGAAAVIAVLRARPELVDGPLQSAAAASQGKSAALLIALVCLGVAVVYGTAVALAPEPRIALSAWAKRAVAVAAVLVVAVAIVAVDPKERFDRFKQAPKQTAIAGGYTQSHLLSGGGSGRWQFWKSAVDEFQTKPAVGRGAGSYEAWWAQHGSLTYFIRDAHSLYIETLGELGLVGIVLLVAAFGSGLVVAATRIRAGPRNDRAVAAALAAAFVAYAFAAGIDWMWELPVVTLAAIACLGLLTGPATRDPESSAEPRPSSGRSRRALAARAAIVVVGALVIFGQSIPMLAQNKIRASQKAIARSDGTSALEDALSARRLEPWAASPYLQLALVQEQTGDLSAAQKSIQKAIDRDRLDWRLWLVSARIYTKAGRIHEARSSLREAKKLNPRSPLFAS